MNTQRTDTHVVFFLTTGRCGTQFFADKLPKHFSDMARVTHEPFQRQYRPRHYFAAYHKGEKVELSPRLEEHIESIEETLKETHYIETGWPAYGLLPHLIERFEGRVKVVHLFRHPLNVAASLSTHNFYGKGDWSDEMCLSPRDHGVIQGHLAGDQWNEMDEFDKCLFWWTEINNYALELRSKSVDLPWLSLKFEDVFSDTGRVKLEEVADFLCLPKREEFLSSLSEKVDRFSRKRTEKVDISQLTKYDDAVRVMGRMGYTSSDISQLEANKRYVKSGLSGVLRKIRGLAGPQ